MQNDLQQVITELQQELQLLEHELNNCLADYDYKGAMKHQKAIGYTKEKLRILHNLDNPNHSMIMELKARILKMKNLEDANEYGQFIRMFNDQQIPLYQATLSRLETKERRYQQDSDEITQGLELLLAHRANTLTIQLPRLTVRIILSLDVDSLHIRLAGLDSETRNTHLASHSLTELRNMQFDLSQEEPIKIVDQFSHDLIPVVMETLSRIVFDVFGLYGDRMALLITA